MEVINVEKFKVAYFNRQNEALFSFLGLNDDITTLSKKKTLLKLNLKKTMAILATVLLQITNENLGAKQLKRGESIGQNRLTLKRVSERGENVDSICRFVVIEVDNTTMKLLTTLNGKHEAE